MEEKYVIVDTAEGKKSISYVEWGIKGELPTVFCVHGLSRNSRDFDYLAQHLSLETTPARHVIALDMIGRGNSDWFTDKTLYGYPHYVHLCLSFLHILGITSVHWVGTSMGGLIGMFIASQNPCKWVCRDEHAPLSENGDTKEKIFKIKNPIKKLVLNDIGPYIPREGLERIGRYVGRDPHFENKTDALLYIQNICSTFGTLKSDQWQHLVNHGLKQCEDHSLSFKYDPAIGDAFQTALDDVDLTSVWYTMNQPTLVLRGSESDLLLKETVHDMAENPDCEFVEFKGVGHAPMLMCDEQIECVARFLMKE